VIARIAGTLSIAKTTSITSMTTKATNKGVAAVCRLLQKNVLYRYDLKWEHLFSPLYTNDFLGSNFPLRLIAFSLP
jgi:hypothetical protein